MAAHGLSVAFPQPFNSRELTRLAAFARAALQLLCDQGAHHGRKADAFTSRFAHERIVLLPFKRNLRAMHDGIYDLNQEKSSYITKQHDVNIKAGWEDSIKTSPSALQGQSRILQQGMKVRIRQSEARRRWEDQSRSKWARA